MQRTNDWCPAPADTDSRASAAPAEGSAREGGRMTKNQRKRKFPQIHLLETSEATYTHEISPVWLPKCDGNSDSDSTSRHAHVEEKTKL